MSLTMDLFNNRMAKRLYMGLALSLAAVVAVLVLIFANGSSDSNYFESRISLTFDGRLNIPTPSEPIPKIQTAPSQADGDFLGKEVDLVAFQFWAPYSTEISDDGQTMTFLARDRSDSTTESFAAAAARRFVAGRHELALYSTPTTIVQLAGIEVAGLKIGHSAIGLLLLAVLAIFAAAIRRTAMPAPICIRDERESVSRDDLRL
jgi:hypothetical protein